MATVFQQELEELKHTLITMMAATEKAVADAVAAVFGYNWTVAEIVMENDEEINELQYRIDALTLKLLALEQPVAVDLRTILGTKNAASQLERIGDEAVNIAERAILLTQHKELHITPEMREMADNTLAMLHKACKALNAGDAALAREVCEMSTRCHVLDMKIFNHAIESMIAVSHAAPRLVHLIFLARALMRIGDRATNLAEITVFIVEAEDIRKDCRPY